MKKQILANSITYLICMVAATLLNLAVSALVVKIVDVLILPEFFVLAIVRAVVGIFTGCLIIGAVFFYEGYKTLSFSFWSVFLSMLIMILSVLISMLLSVSQVVYLTFSGFAISIRAFSGKPANGLDISLFFENTTLKISSVQRFMCRYTLSIVLSAGFV